MNLRSLRAIVLTSTVSASLSLAACSDDKAPSGGDTTGELDALPGDADETDAILDDTTIEDGLADSVDLPDGEVPTDTVVTPDVTEPVIPPVNVAPDPNDCTPLGGDLNVFDLQNPECPDHMHPEPEGTDGVYVEIDNLVITANFGDTFFAQDPRGGPYSGITLFARGDFRDEAVPGAVVSVTGNYSEFFENTQIVVASLTVVGNGDVPAPFEVLHPAHVQTNGPLAEMFEGVLVKVVDVATTNTQPDCPFEFGEFEVAGALRIDDMGYRWDARLGDRFASITGPLNFSFGNHKIEPRDASDVITTAVGNPTAISKCIAEECQAPPEMTGSREVVINEIMPDPAGSDTNQEWVELYNPGSQPVNIEGWQLRDCATQALTIRAPNLTIPARGYLVVGMSNNSAVNGGADVDIAYGNSSFYMPNTIGAVLLYDGPGTEANLIDQMRYSRFGDWSSVFRSAYSLERRSPSVDATVPAGWARAKDSYGQGGNHGTPGAKNDAR